MDDEGILALYRDRREQALLETQAKYGRLCTRVADGILTDARDTEECVNDTYLHAWNAIPPEWPARLGAWLARVTRNLALSRLRSRTAQKRGGSELPVLLDELSECLPGGEDPQQQIEGRELAAYIDRFLEGLKKEERDLFVARYFFAATLPELQECTHWSSGRISSMLQRTRKKMKHYLLEEGLW